MIVNCNKYGEKRKDNKKKTIILVIIHTLLYTLKKFYSTCNCKVMTKLAT